MSPFPQHKECSPNSSIQLWASLGQTEFTVIYFDDLLIMHQDKKELLEQISVAEFVKSDSTTRIWGISCSCGFARCIGFSNQLSQISIGANVDNQLLQFCGQLSEERIEAAKGEDQPDQAGRQRSTHWTTSGEDVSSNSGNTPCSLTLQKTSEHQVQSFEIEGLRFWSKGFTERKTRSNLRGRQFRPVEWKEVSVNSSQYLNRDRCITLWMGSVLARREYGRLLGLRRTSLPNQCPGTAGSVLCPKSFSQKTSQSWPTSTR